MEVKDTVGSHMKLPPFGTYDRCTVNNDVSINAFCWQEGPSSRTAGNKKDPKCSKLFKNGELMMRRGQMEEAARCFKDAADGGHKAAAIRYGVMRWEGIGGEKDLQEAARYIKQAADLGSASCQFGYGVILSEGKGVEKNDEEAARYFEQSADNGDPNGQCNFGRCLLEGRGVTKNARLAVYYFALAAISGNADAMNSLGVCLSKGNGISKNQQAAVAWFKRATELGNSDGKFNYAKSLLNGSGTERNVKKAVEYLKELAENGYTAAQNTYGCCLRDGVGGVHDIDLALRYFKAAADKGNATAQVNYGNLLLRYSTWKTSTGEDMNLCYNSDSMDECIPNFIRELDSENAQKAAQYFKKAADQKDPAGQNNYGTCLRYGIGVNQDKVKAADYFKSAAKQGYAPAKYNLNTCLRKLNAALAHITSTRPTRRNTFASFNHRYSNTSDPHEIVSGRGELPTCSNAQSKDNSLDNFKHTIVLKSDMIDSFREKVIRISIFINHAFVNHYDPFLDSKLEYGTGVTMNSDAAIAYIKKLADQGNRDARDLYGRYLYNIGKKTEADDYLRFDSKNAFSWSHCVLTEYNIDNKIRAFHFNTGKPNEFDMTDDF